jgi:arginase
MQSTYALRRTTSALFCKSRPNLTICDVPYSGGQPHGGVGVAANMLYKYGLKDYLSLTTKFNQKNYTDIKPACISRPDMFFQAMTLPSEDFKLFIGGDHSMSIATGSSFLSKHENPGIVVVDSHADLNTSETSPSGNIHGMTFAKLMGLDRFNWMNNFGVPLLKPSNIVYIGIHDLDEAEVELINRFDIKTWTANEVNQIGFSSTLYNALDYLENCSSIMVSFDVDSLDPSIISGTGTPVLDGLKKNDVMDGLWHVTEDERVKQFELVEFNPELCVNNRLDIECYHVIDIILSAVASDVQEIFL